jgi:non-reducing end alpha-L-arabinofuranosidase
MFQYGGRVNRFTAILAVIVGLSFVQLTPPVVAQPCDIYAAASPATPCCGAYSTVRKLYSTYTGPLYQVRRTTGGTTMDINPGTPGADQDAFLGTSAGTISKIYDQSGRGNHLTVAKKGSYTGTAAQNDNECNAKGKSIMFNGVKAYGVYINVQEGYRNNQEGYAGYNATAPLGNGIPTGNQAQGSYALNDGARTSPTNPVGCCCCFNFGTASRNNAAGGRGQMNALYFGTGYWDSGLPSGPWFMIDVEAGVYAGGDPNNNLPSSKFDYAFGLTKNNSGNATIRVANSTCLYGATAPSLTTALNANPPPFSWNVPGGITLGIGGDNSNSSNGTFYEGCIVNGRPSDATDLAVMNNVRLAGYGSNTVVNPSAVSYSGSNGAAAMPLFSVCYNPSSARAVISYTLQDARKVSMNIFDGRGRLVAAIVNGINPAGQRTAVWDTKRVPAGAYLCRVAIDGMGERTERITVQ